MKTGNGKIANLPSHLRDELNLRISHGDEGIELVEWLNSKPEVANAVNELFDGTPISEQNLSEWRKRGYQKWLARRNAIDESNAIYDNSADIAVTGIDPDKLLLTLTGAYAEAIRNWMITPGEQMPYKLAVYKNLTNGVIALQRAELQKVRLEIARERLDLLREKRLNKSASTAAAPISSTEAVGRGALRRAQGLEQAKRVETAGGGPGKSRAAECAASELPRDSRAECTARSADPRRETLLAWRQEPQHLRVESPYGTASPIDPPPPKPPEASGASEPPHSVTAPLALPPSVPAPDLSPQPAAPIRGRSVPPGTVLSINPLRIAQRPANNS